MKRHFMLSWWTGTAICLLNTPVWATPLPQQSPSDSQPQENQVSQAKPSSPATSKMQPTRPAKAPDLPQLPTTSNSTTPSAGLEGLTDESSIMDQDHLTGDWGGFRNTLVNHGITLTPSWIGEVFGNPTGGADHGLISDGLFNLALDLDLDRMSDSSLFDNTLIHANAMYIYGASLSGSFVGDFSNTSNIAAYNGVRLQEIWLQKQFWEKRISVKVGNIAVDTEFFLSASSALFLNGTFGAPTIFSVTVPNAPVYPLANPGVRVRFDPVSNFYVMAGVFGLDNGSDPSINNKNGTRFSMNGKSGVLVMSEAGYLVNQSPNDRGLTSTYKIGSWLDTGNFQTFESQASATNATGEFQSAGANFGIYGVMDQQIFAHGAQAIRLFVRAGGSPDNTSFVDYYVDGGFNFTGFVPGRDSDVAGIAVARQHISRPFGDASIATGGGIYTAETVIEATYKAQIAPWWTIQPDVQYIITPGGAPSPALGDALVLGLRTSATF